MNIFISLNGHANQATIPLRMGVTLRKEHQAHARLHDAQYDDEGTRSQRQNEIDKGRKHYLGELVVQPENEGDEEIRLSCRAVLSEPRTHYQDPGLVTILRSDGNKGDLTVSLALESLLKKNKISTEDIISYFHKPYIEGQIRDSHDVYEMYSQIPKDKVVYTGGDSTGGAVLGNPGAVGGSMGGDDVEGDLLSPPIFKPMNISGVSYSYSMADAYIDNVRLDNDMIVLETVNSKGEKADIHSFKLSSRPHLSKLHQYAYDYLKGREGQRGYFAVCTTGPCKGFLAESVTAIALQMQKSGVV